jgi:ferrous iron transport protein B
VVTDATALERNLNLVLQVLEITGRAVIALNLMDEAERHGLQVDARRLARDLGVPVVPMVARRGEGVEGLLEVIAQVAGGSYQTRPHRMKQREPALEAAAAELTEAVEALFPGLPNARWVALRLLDGDESIIRAVRERTLGDLTTGEGSRLDKPMSLEVVS